MMPQNQNPGPNYGPDYGSNHEDSSGFPGEGQWGNSYPGYGGGPTYGGQIHYGPPREPSRPDAGWQPTPSDWTSNTYGNPFGYDQSPQIPQAIPERHGGWRNRVSTRVVALLGTA